MEKAPLIDASDDPRMVGESSSAGARAASIDRSVLSVFGGRRTPDAASGDEEDSRLAPRPSSRSANRPDDATFMKMVVGVLLVVFVARRFGFSIDARMWAGRGIDSFQPPEISCAPATVSAGAQASCSVRHGSAAMVWERTGDVDNLKVAVPE